MPHTDDDPYTSPTYPHRQVRLDSLRFGSQIPIGRGVMESMRAEVLQDAVIGQAVLKLSGFLLAEELPPLTLDNRVPFTVPRFATWWDQWKAAHWDRWYVWALREAGWIRPARFIDEPHTHTATLDVRTRWTYPRATTVAPGRGYGHVVLKTDTTVSHFGARPW